MVGLGHRLWGFWRRLAGMGRNPSPRPAGPPLLLEPSHRRFRRLARWCVTSRVAAAELELHEWARHADCPPEARALLGALLARRGELEQATHLLGRASDGADAPALGQLLVAILTARGLNEAARRALAHLHAHAGHRGDIALWLSHMSCPGATDLPAVPGSLVERLSAEIARHPETIATLVAAQKLAPDQQQLPLLRLALERAAMALDSREWGQTVFTALAELALLAHDYDEARRWAHRGLRAHPFSAPLALVLAQVSDDPAIGPPAAEVLQTASAAHPGYPDLRAALIRRRHSQGQIEVARHRLQEWLARDPEHPVARALEREIAA